MSDRAVVNGAHSNAPDHVVVEVDPWGAVRTYAYFDRWSFEARKFDTGYMMSEPEDLDAAIKYARLWCRTGVEPDMGKDPR